MLHVAVLKHLKAYRTSVLKRNLPARTLAKMGCYLSKVDDKVYITEGKGRNFDYVSASCQGWRREQEDAEVCLSEFDDDASLFILCDGHGGAEVAKYTVAHLPDFIKNHQLYKEGKYEELLNSVLVDFDAHLRTDKVMELLEIISKDGEVETNKDSSTNPEDAQAGSSTSSSTEQNSSSNPQPSTSKSNGASSVAEDVDCATLRREAQVPIEELINKYADASAKSRIVSLNDIVKEGGDEMACDAGPSVLDQPEPSSSKGGGEEGPSSTSDNSALSRLDLLRKVYMNMMENTDEEDDDDDSEYEGSEDSDDDEDSDDGDDECDEETPGARSKKPLSKKHRKAPNNRGESSSDEDDGEDDSEEDEEEEDDDDDDDDESGTSDDESESEDENGAEDEDGEDIAGRINKKVLAFKKLNQKLSKKIHRPGLDSGCTVVVALVKNNKLYVASAGDSRCIMIMRDGTCKAMSFDHKPEDPVELTRISKAGGLVCEGRVNGGLNLSRALGDFIYKDEKLPAKDQIITPCPDVLVADLNPDKVAYILLACDGIWNSYSNSEVAEFVHKQGPNLEDLAEICARLFKITLAKDCDGDGTGCDNMTCILVRYNSSSVTESSTNNQTDLKLSSTTNDSEENLDEAKKESEQKQSSKRQANEELGSDSSCKRRCLHLLDPTES